MGDASVLIADWGTSSFRLWALDRAGSVLSARQEGFGMSRLKPADFHPVLEDAIAAMGAGPDTPVMICGMAGAAQGWHEAPYADVPARLPDLPARAVRAPGIARDVRILPGLAQRYPDAPEVMRGEETILLGARIAHGTEGTVCLPGTHSKWARLRGDAVERFSTAMTGELFALLSTHSTLAPFIGGERTSHEDSPAFDAALREALARPERALRALFSVRAMPLLMGSEVARDMPARLSGLLIGLELAGMRKGEGHAVTLISGGVLARNYAHAFETAGIACVRLDAEEMARAGLAAAARAAWPDRLEEMP